MPHKRYNLKDNAYYQLANSINASVTTINITNPTTYTWRKQPPASNWIGTLVKFWVDGNPSKMEKVYVTATAWTALSVTRGYLWDGAQSFDADDYLFLNITSEVIDDIHLRIDEVESFQQDQLDDLYLDGSHRLRVYRVSTDPALQVTIGAWGFRVGSLDGSYAGWTLTVADNVTTYVMINNGGSIVTSTSWWNGLYARLATVVSSGGVITSIGNYKSDAVGGDFWGNPTGAIVMWWLATAPAWYLICDGTAVSRATYSGLFSVIGTNFGAWDGSTTFNLPNPTGRMMVGIKSATSLGTATITNASPWVITNTGHWLANGNQIYFTTTWSLPTGLTANTKYFVKNATANTFEVSATLWGASINTSSAWSGTHTLFSSDFDTIGQTGWEKNHTLSVEEIPSHTHQTNNTSSNATVAPVALSSWNNSSNWPFSTTATWWGLSHNNLPPYFGINFIIKT